MFHEHQVVRAIQESVKELQTKANLGLSIVENYLDRTKLKAKPPTRSHLASPIHGWRNNPPLLTAAASNTTETLGVNNSSKVSSENSDNLKTYSSFSK